MWNGTDYGTTTTDLVDRFMQHLRTVVPFGTRNQLAPPSLPGDGGWDAHIRWTIATQSVDLGVEVKLSADAIEVSQLPRTEPAVAPALIAPFIPLRKHIHTAGELRYVTPWRAVGDLLSMPGRLASVGEDLARDLIED